MAILRNIRSGDFQLPGKYCSKKFLPNIFKKRQHFPNFSLVDNFINHTFCDEGETDFFRSGIGDGLEESVYFCACHLGWELVITV